MPEAVVQFLMSIIVAQLIAIGFMLWFFYNRLDNKIEKLDMKLEKLEDKVEDIDRRLCRIEGSLATQGHCLYSQQKPEQTTRGENR